MLGSSFLLSVLEHYIGHILPSIEGILREDMKRKRELPAKLVPFINAHLFENLRL